MKSSDQVSNGTSLWQLIILVLCIYVLLVLAVETFLKLPQEISILLGRIDNIICYIFVGDFLYNVIGSKNKKAYLKWGWLDLISSIPQVQFLRWGRFIRVVRILRLLRGVRSLKRLFAFLFENRSKAAFASASLIAFLCLISSSIAILLCETSPESNIRTASDALWWSFVTVTTVGYGDFYPVTLLGRIIAGILMTVGIGFFGTFTAYVASFFVGDKAIPPADEEILAKLVYIEKTLSMIQSEQEKISRGE